MKIDELVEMANKHSHAAYMDANGLDTAEALTYWAYISSKLLVTIAELNRIPRESVPAIIGELRAAIEQQYGALDNFLKNNKNG